MSDFVVGGGPGGLRRSPSSRGNADGTAGAFLSSFHVYEAAFSGGVFVAAMDLNGDGKADLIAGSGDGERPRARVYKAATLTASGSPSPDQTLDLFDSAALANGVYVG